MATHLLLLVGVPIAEVLRQVRDIRRDRYRMLRGFFHGEEAADGEHPGAFRERLHSVTLTKEAYAAGRLLADLHLADLGITVTAVRRGGIRGPEPDDTTLLQAGDVLVLYGTPEALEKAEALVLGNL
jgi:CPA2 family monovalent cation:H+ antiporter-2